MRRKYRWFILGGMLMIGGLGWGQLVSSVEQPTYSIIATDGAIVIRDYPSMVVAETTVAGTRERAISQGFRTIAGYIFGDNLQSQKIAMTAPVMQQATQSAELTAESNQINHDNAWQVRFVMPRGSAISNLAEPRNPAIKLKEIAVKRFAVIRFSGIACDTRLTRYGDQLNQYIKTKNLTPRATKIYAFYDPPWKLPFLRRNEIMMEVEG